MSAILGQESVGAVDALPRIVAEAIEDDLLKEGSAVAACGVVPVAPGAANGGDGSETFGFDFDCRVGADRSKDRWGFGWHRRAEPPSLFSLFREDRARLRIAI